MQEYVPWYINEYLDTNVPWWIIAVTVAVAVMASGFRWGHGVSRGGRRSGPISAIWLIAYMTYLLCDTVIFRTSAPEAHHIFTPFWNYYDVFINGNLEDLGEIIMNIAAFLPVGVLANCSFRFQRVSGFKRFQVVLALGCCFSLTIELLQLVLHRGLCETDDVIHNTVGCAIGAGMVWLIEKLRKYGKVL